LARDGTQTPCHFTGRAAVIEGRRHLVAVGIDISSRRRAEAEVRRLHDTLRQHATELEQRVAERTAELEIARDRAQESDRLKSAFLATMSHELRTPLNSIIGFTGILLQRLAGPLNDEQAHQLGMVQGSARHLLEVINDILDLSKIEAGELRVSREPFDLRAVLERVAAAVRPMAAEKGLALGVDVGPGAGIITSDERRVEQVLLNLLDNAVKFTPAGSVTLTARFDNASVTVAVADTGIGISRDDAATLFQPFRQIDSGLTSQHEGTGLGLPICRRLLTLLGGEIGVESEPGAGSVFTITLPVDAAGGATR
ncbi:MAG: ATP-binding protein, partial [Vicinamibacterales bacterium]